MPTTRAAAIAMHRFGYGAGAADVSAAMGPERWLTGQLRGPIVLPEGLPLAATYLHERLAGLSSRGSRRSQRVEELRDENHRRFRKLVAERSNLVRVGSAPLVERLVHFWSNHFAVSSARRGLGHVALAYEFEAVRPHVLGGFPELLLGAIAHPAMLIYLDNDQSTGPDSPRAELRPGDINENLAREILELHTLGVDGGFTQRDVEELALGLTGWRWGRLDAARPGAFLFDPEHHQAGARTLLGRRYGAEGRSQGESMLYDLALHPATAAHLVGKLALHFLGAGAPEAIQLAARRTYLETGGSLRATCQRLLVNDYALEAPLGHFKTPQQFWYSAERTTGATTEPREIIAALAGMAQPLGKPPSPAGWSEARDDYGGGAAFRERLRVAAELAERKTSLRWVDLLDRAYGPLASSATRQALANAESPRQAGALFLMSPEFQSR